MFRTGSWRFAVIALLATLSAVPALAQAQTGRISGVVRDTRGAPLVAARVTATNSITGVARSSSTTADGAYSITGLAPGGYDVSISLIGFRRATRADVQVASGEVRADFTLDPVLLQEVIVTATLREQELADVPFSIAAPTATVLRQRGADNIETIAVTVAGFSVQNLGPGQSQVAMRGASSGQIARDQPGVKEQVGAYLDDSPISLSLFTPDLDLFDLSRVEVLRGPQGTLFGSGSLAGTVRYITNQPELGARSTFGEIGGNWIHGGNAGAVVKLGANVPLGESSAGRMAVYHNQLAGYMDAVQPDLGVDENVNTGTRTGVRAAVRYAPEERWSITPRIVFQTVRMEGWNRIDAFNILANPFTTTRPQVRLGERQLFTQFPEPFTDDFVLGDVNVQYDFGGVNLTSITSYTYRDILVVRDAGALTSSITGGSIGLPEEIYTLNAPLDDATRVDVVTQEVRLAGGTGRTRWLVGGFFSSNQREYGQRLLVSGFEAASGIPTQGLRAARDVLFYSDLSYDARQIAVFGEATVGVTDRLDLTGGLRYYSFDEDREQIFDGLFGNDDNGTTLVSTPGSVKADGFAPRAIASFRATDMLTLNAQASRGFRLGGINDPLNVPLCTVQDSITFSGRDAWRDETAWNYEVGAKARMLGGRAAINVSAFYMDISDLQLTVTAGSCSSRLIFNVDKARSQGVELEITATPNQNLDFSIAASLNDSELQSTVLSEGQPVSGMEAGNRLPSVPRVQVSAAATYGWPVGLASRAFLSGSVQHVGSRITQISDHSPGFGTVDMTGFEQAGGETIGGPLTQSTFTFDPVLPAYNLVNLRAGLIRDAWELAVFMNNVTDERAFLALDQERGTRARVGYLTNQPRTLGVTLAFQY
ncbi:MAG TPA: TonB-dependent receptor [Gemmatimonadaceae bacterium]|nr:TonB-dependent receptor [Gemmatimonadaceae bacterium]